MSVNLKSWSLTPIASAIIILAGFAGLAGCSGSDDNGSNSTPITSQTASQTNLVCDDSLKSGFKPDANTSVLLVKAFKKGDPLILSGAATATTPTASNDVCVVKLNVGPGNPGPADAPSTSTGIGIEVWLPTPANWNNRIHVLGGGGWAGGVQGSTTALAGAASASAGSAAGNAMVEGAVSATTDTGHANTANGGSFAMNPDGTINTTLWKDFSERGIHEMAVKTKALTKAFYGSDAKFSYWDGFSTGGRQGEKEAQANPADFDGILAGAPAFNWTKFITGELYPQVVMQRDLAGVNLTTAQLNLMSNAAINACDVVGGQHLGYIPDPMQCSYDPRKDAAVLCPGQAGIGVTGASTSAACVNVTQATAMNKIWYGQTSDGSVPDPVADNGTGIVPASNQKWYGLTRGTSMLGLAGAAPFTIASDITALELQNPLIATPAFINATGNGANGWKNLTYADLANASDRGVALQSAFANINTDNPDLSAFKARNGKMIMYHGLSDTLIPPQGSINYYNRVANQMGGLTSIQSFYRFYLVPGMAHGFGNGTANPNANPPLPTVTQLYGLLTEWVEKGTAPGTITATAAATATTPAKARPLCLYPLKATYTSGDPNQVGSYTCS